MSRSVTGAVPPGIDPRGVAEAVRSIARRTPLLGDWRLSGRLGRPVWIKAECLQVTGSFKVRGAAARLAALTPSERERGVVACSSGNHGRALAHVAAELGVPASVYVPEWVDPVKLEGIRASGAEAVVTGASFDASEAAALRDARESGRTYVSAYDDPWVIAGQGTIGLEILEQLGEPPGVVVAPLSGGGLIGGIAAALDARPSGDGPEIVAVSAENAAVMHESVRVGRPVELPERETLANALAGGIGPDNRHSFPLVRDTVDRFLTVSEADIAVAMRWCVEKLRLVVEGGGAVGLAALLAGLFPAETDGSVVVVLSGGNVAPETLIRVLEGEDRGGAP